MTAHFSLVKAPWRVTPAPAHRLALAAWLLVAAAGAQAARVSRSCRDPFLTLLSAFAQGVLNGDPPPSAKKKAAGGGGGGGGGGGAGDAKKKAAKQG